MSFWANYWDVVAFYIVVLLLLYIFRSKFKFEGIVALLRTKIGIAWMTRMGEEHKRFWNTIGLIAIVIGFAGMTLICVLLLVGIYNLFFVPQAPPMFSPLLPGVKIPGQPIVFPLWYTLIALFIAVLVHEAAHGLLAASYKLRIKSTGFAMFGPIPAAFVEPDEKEMEKRSRRQQMAVAAAGPFANAVLTLVAVGVVISIGLVAGTLVSEQGVTYKSLQPGGAAAEAGMPQAGTILQVDGTEISSTSNLTAAIAAHNPGERALIATDAGIYAVTFAEHPQDASKAYLGVLDVDTKYVPHNPSLGWVYIGLSMLGTLLYWTYAISIGLGLANLLPIGPVDGGRMFYLALLSRIEEVKAKRFFGRWSMALLIIVILLVFVPIIRAIL